ncbi:MAG: 3-hydroxyacyl-ACP dehydratase FabZ [Proteobacteria bacterium]|nr:3-hydroxyacyl-ACP dehydratase FabZ [Pseudomonadota bacterium]
MLMVDRILSLDLDAGTVVGRKNVTMAEPHFAGHFPGQPVMPGVLIVEAMAQTSAILVNTTIGKNADEVLFYFMSLDKVRFRHPVVPGDVLELHVKLNRRKGDVWVFGGEGVVDGKKVAEAEFMAKVIQR